MRREGAAQHCPAVLEDRNPVMDGHYIGLMSGTSMDAVDAALVEFRGGAVALPAHHSQPLTATLRESLLRAAHDAATPLSRMTGLDVRLGRLFAQAVFSALCVCGVLF